MITYLFDKIRITFGDSKCPLSHKCPGYDLDNNSCVTYRGREEVGANRAECYKYFKMDVKAQKPGLISRLAEKITKDFMHIGGLEE